MEETFTSAGTRSRLLVIEPLIVNDDATPCERMDDLFQMVICEEGTTARTEPGMRRLLESALFDISKIVELRTRHSLIEAVPAHSSAR
jgi:hypothetical protein